MIDELRALGQLENTLIVLLSDNGASAEGGPAGAINMRKHLVYEKESVAGMLPRIEQIGTENAYNHYAAGWAQVSNAPLKWYKQDAHGGGIRAPLVIHWPARIRQSHALRSQFHHAIDIAPTILAAAGVRMPAEFRGRSQPPLDGVDMGYSFDDAARPARRRTQYFEWAGDRGIWHEGWKAVVRHVKGTDFNLDTWELYHLEEDFSECRDLAGAEPQRLKAMIELWEREAKANAVLPLDDRDIERAHARSAMEPVRSHRYSSSMVRVDRLNAPNVLGRPHEIRARIAPFRAGTQGVLLAWGSRFGGLALYVEADHLVFEYVYSLDERQLLRSTRPVPDGCRQLAVRLVPPAAEPGSATLMLDGGLAGRMVIERFWPPYGVTAGITVGRDGGCPVSERYAAPFPYPGDDWLIEIEIDNKLN